MVLHVGRTACKETKVPGHWAREGSQTVLGRRGAPDFIFFFLRSCRLRRVLQRETGCKLREA